MDPLEQERPSIHVTILQGADPALYRWVQIGAEEEGVPCRLVDSEGDDLAARAYEAAQSSRFGVGVSVSHDAAVLHERHMPLQQPVMALPLTGRPDYFCRMAGANAARMIVRRPLRFSDDEERLPQPRGKVHPSWRPGGKTHSQPAAVEPAAASPDVDLTFIARVAALVILKLQERGVQ